MCTMSVTGRMVGTGAVVLTVSMTEGVEEASGGVWPESVGGGGVGEGETDIGLGGVGEQGDISLTQGEVGSNCSGWGCMTGGMGESLVEGVDIDSSTISNWMGMSVCGLVEGGASEEVLSMRSVIGAGGVEDGERLSCIDGVGESSKVA